jgi:hypothetical protein
MCVYILAVYRDRVCMVEVEADILSEVINCTGYHKPATEFGERAWLAEGKDVDVIYWDEGNNWCLCLIMLVIPKNCQSCKEKIVEFYRKLEKTIEEKSDEEYE